MTNLHVNSRENSQDYKLSTVTRTGNLSPPGCVLRPATHSLKRTHTKYRVISTDLGSVWAHNIQKQEKLILILPFTKRERESPFSQGIYQKTCNCKLFLCPFEMYVNLSKSLRSLLLAFQVRNVFLKALEALFCNSNIGKITTLSPSLGRKVGALLQLRCGSKLQTHPLPTTKIGAILFFFR